MGPFGTIKYEKLTLISSIKPVVLLHEDGVETSQGWILFGADVPSHALAIDQREKVAIGLEKALQMLFVFHEEHITLTFYLEEDVFSCKK